MWAKSWQTKTLTKGREECGVELFLNHRRPPTTQRTRRDNKEDERRPS